MNTDQYGDDVAEPDEDRITAAFAAYRADAPSAFPPPPVDELIMSGPAALRRRRLVSLAAVVGACTAVTAGGFAVAQTLGSLPAEPEKDSSSGVVQESSPEEHPPSTQMGDPATPHVEDESPSAQESEQVDVEMAETLQIADWAGVCAGGTFGYDQGAWEFTEETAWTVEQSFGADLDADGNWELLLALTCEDRTAVAAFSPVDDGLVHWDWVWQPDESQELSAIGDVDGGVITLHGFVGAASETWTARYEWDGEDFVMIDDTPTTDPSSSASTATPDTDETQTTQASPTADGQVS